ncbi:MAG: enoyl-CoA hydratase/isomerase family protein [Betaproteobacteria bacterium]|nr:enoyl-CoA hydratase/isomerase family protein [Betaproteobacteria bacterium]
MSAQVIIQREDGVARVVIDHAAKANALTGALLVELYDALEDLSLEPVPRAVVLTGAGERAFIGGAFIDEMAALDAASAREFIMHVHRACDALRRFPAPVIARIQGHTLGAGLELAISCDIRIAAEEAVFGMPEVRLGIPSVVEAALLPRVIGAGRARWLLLTGNSIGAREALDWGLVEEVVPRASLDAAVDGVLTALLACGPAALRAQKLLIKRWEDESLPAGIAAGIDAFAAAYAGTEPRERMAAFLQAKKGKG